MKKLQLHFLTERGELAKDTPTNAADVNAAYFEALELLHRQPEGVTSCDIMDGDTVAEHVEETAPDVTEAAKRHGLEIITGRIKSPADLVLHALNERERYHHDGGDVRPVLALVFRPGDVLAIDEIVEIIGGPVALHAVRHHIDELTEEPTDDGGIYAADGLFKSIDGGGTVVRSGRSEAHGGPAFITYDNKLITTETPTQNPPTYEI